MRLPQRAESSSDKLGVLGMLEVDRAIPIWTKPCDDVIRYPRRWTLEEHGLEIALRLIAIAPREKEWRIFPQVLVAWGLSDVSRLDAVARTAEGFEVPAKEMRWPEEPREVDTPRSQEQNRAVEWSILDPNGPTICQLEVVSLAGGESSALVWTMPHFLAKRSVLLTVWRSDDRESLKTALERLFLSSGWPEIELITSRPHWVLIKAAKLHSRDIWARLFAFAHQLQLERDRLRGDDPDRELANLKAMAEDPVREVLRLERETLEAHLPAMKALFAGDTDGGERLIEEAKDQRALKALPELAAYRRRLDYAASETNVASLRPHFEGANQEAYRRLAAAGGVGEA